ncbi:MAG: zinc metallopeptidase [Verrucomicrobiota bacterium]
MLYFLLLLGIPMIIGIYAQIKVGSTYNKYKQVASRGGITGAEAARYVLRSAGIDDVEITMTGGHLTDHYDPRHKRLVLSEENARGTSLAALGVAAHEAGHAIQHKVGYRMLKFRMTLVPATQFASQILPFAIFGGLIFAQFRELLWLGVAGYLVLTLFQLVTLPVEFDATSRAKQQLVGLGILGENEMPGVNKTLDAAALTYVAAFVASLGNLIYLILIARR